MNKNSILKYMRMHNKEIKQFIERLNRNIEPLCKPNPSGYYDPSTTVKKNVNGLKITFDSYHLVYNSNFKTSVYNKEEHLLIQFSTKVKLEYNTGKCVESKNTYGNFIQSQYIRLSNSEDLFIYNMKLLIKNIIPKDEYFNLSLTENICLYELYEIGLKLYKSLTPGVELIITPNILE